MAVMFEDKSISQEAWAIASHLAPLPALCSTNWSFYFEKPTLVETNTKAVWWVTDKNVDYSRWCLEGGSAVCQQLLEDGLQVCCYHQGQRYQLKTTRFKKLLSPEKVAAFLLHDYDLHDAVALAMASCGETWPDELAKFPSLQGVTTSEKPFATCPNALGLYPVVPSSDWIAKLLALGVRTLQLRCKHPDPGVVREEVTKAVQLAKAYDAPNDPVRLFINDHWQLAIELGAYGVHLGQEDLQTAILEIIQEAGLRLGVSTHGYVEMLRAHALKPSYIAMGAIYATPTKSMPTLPQGVIKLGQYVKLMESHYPLVAIGGISLVEMPLVKQSGVKSIAVVRAVTEAEDLTQAVKQLQQVVEG
ncbi:thiamine phosphate synthase [Leeia speluncae]|uniref:thiamine phosphate synthase n=1 Tax=Leeia speluncae TaxID=2884804 RepID=UPI003570A774